MTKKQMLSIAFCLFLLLPLTQNALSSISFKTYSINSIKSSIITVAGTSIQEAINVANPGDTVFVKAGTYYEHIEINKTISLTGENSTTTILDGDGQGLFPIILITKPDVTVTNFTIKNTAATVETYGILVSNTKNVTLTNNIIKETYRAIMILNASSCRVFNNSILNNYAYGISLRSNGIGNLFVSNTIMENPTGVSPEISCQNNTFYHNNFVNNINQVPAILETKNKWDNDYPSGGNYWSDYTGIDLYRGPSQNENGSDGIGDTFYENIVRDNYPLMYPWGSIPPIAKFTYSPEIPINNEFIIFNASASYDQDGNITSYRWNFGDGNVTNTLDQTITHSYPECRNYTVTLTVTDDTNLTDSRTEVISVRKRTSTLTMLVYPSKVEIGKSVTINGTLSIERSSSREANITILYRIQSHLEWMILNATLTNSEGLYYCTWKPTNIEAYELMGSWEGDTTTNPSNSSVVTLNVTKRSSKLTIFVTPTAVTVGSNLTITGKLEPIAQEENITIAYQNLYISNIWENLTTLKTDSNGNYIYNWTTTKTGTYILKVSWQGDKQTFRSENRSGFITISKISSNITIVVNPETVELGSNITISGKITPSRANVTVTIHIKAVNGTSSWNITINTKINGDYEYPWKPTNVGSYYIKASWQGDTYTTSAESGTLTVMVDPRIEIPGVYVLVGAILVVLIAGVIWKIKKR